MLIGPGEADIWFDGAGDFVKEYIQSMAALPQYSPQGETHILRSSSVLVTSSYFPGGVSYRTFDSTASEKIHVNFTPSFVYSGGAQIASWSYDPASGILTVAHASPDVAVNLVPPDPPSVLMEETE